MVWAFDERGRRAHTEKNTDDRHSRKKREKTTKDQSGKMLVMLIAFEAISRSTWIPARRPPHTREKPGEEGVVPLKVFSPRCRLSNWKHWTHIHTYTHLIMVRFLWQICYIVIRGLAGSAVNNVVNRIVSRLVENSSEGLLLYGLRRIPDIKQVGRWCHDRCYIRLCLVYWCVYLSSSFSFPLHYVWV